MSRASCSWAKQSESHGYWQVRPASHFRDCIQWPLILTQSTQDRVFPGLNCAFWLNIAIVWQDCGNNTNTFRKMLQCLADGMTLSSTNKNIFLLRKYSMCLQQAANRCIMTLNESKWCCFFESSRIDWPEQGYSFFVDRNYFCCIILLQNVFPALFCTHTENIPWKPLSRSKCLCPRCTIKETHTCSLKLYNTPHILLKTTQNHPLSTTIPSIPSITTSTSTSTLTFTFTHHIHIQPKSPPQDQ